MFDSDSMVYTQFKILTSPDNKTWTVAADLTREPKRDRACAYVEFTKPQRARYVRYEHVYTAGQHLSINPDKLYQTYQFWNDQPNTFELRALNVGVPYYFAIESFNETGVSTP